MVDSWVIRHPMLSQCQVRHGFFTRNGGVSVQAFTSLNCGLKTEDDPKAVQENRRRVAKEMGVAAECLWGAVQIHSTKVIAVKVGDKTTYEADGAITTEPDIAISVLTADCAPVLFSTPDGKMVGAAHAGWRGAAFGILEATIDQMVSAGAKAETITAVIGPCISAKGYEVREDMRSEVIGQDPSGTPYFASVGEGFYKFDLAGYCLHRLKRRGLIHCAALNLDTLSNEAHFFSHRRRVLAGGGPLGLQISSIACRKG